MKLLIISDYIYPDFSGGVAKHVKYVFDLLRKKGRLDYKIYTRGLISSNYNVGDSQDHKNLVKLRQYGFFNFLKNLFRDYKDAEKVIVHYYTLGFFAFIFSLITGKKYELFFHGPMDDEFYQKEIKSNALKRYIGTFFRRFLQFLVLQRAEKVHFHSNFMHDIAMNKGLSKKSKISFIPPFIMSDIEIKKESFKKNFFLISRRLTPRTGVIEFLKQYVGSEFKDDYQIYVTGNGELENEVKLLSEEHKFIKYLGHVDEDELNQLLEDAAATILPTRSLEGFGYIILEAYSKGTPALVSDHCGGGYDFVKSYFPDSAFVLDNIKSFDKSVKNSLSINQKKFKVVAGDYTFENMFNKLYE